MPSKKLFGVPLDRQSLGEMIRFSIVGVLVTAIHYAVYVKNGAGFGVAHIINYLLQMVLLNVFLKMGLSPTMAPVGVYAVSIPVNYILVRFVFKHS